MENQKNKITYCGEVLATVRKTDYGEIFAPNNKVILVGKIMNEFKYSHQRYYRIKVRLGRGQVNCVWIYVPENLAIWKMQKHSKLLNKYVEIAGCFHSSQRRTAGLYVSYFKVLDEQEQEYINCCYFRGEITELFYGRTVEMTLKVNDGGGKDLIRCIAYKNKAKQACKLELGTEVEIVGEIQRVPTEKNDNEKVIRQTEIIIKKMRKC